MRCGGQRACNPTRIGESGGARRAEALFNRAIQRMVSTVQPSRPTSSFAIGVNSPVVTSSGWPCSCGAALATY
jgi:hypothetical protein